MSEPYRQSSAASLLDSKMNHDHFVRFLRKSDEAKLILKSLNLVSSIRFALDLLIARFRFLRSLAVNRLIKSYLIGLETVCSALLNKRYVLSERRIRTHYHNAMGLAIVPYTYNEHCVMAKFVVANIVRS